MRKWIYILLPVLALLLYGCASETTAESTAAEETIPAATIPADGNPGDVTCKGSYSGQVDADAVAAVCADTQLTLGELQVWYWAQAAQYRQENHAIMPDFSLPLDTQVCQIDDSVGSWQQYFLRQALERWHTAQALVHQSETVPMPTEEAYKPSKKNHETYMTGIPANEVRYGYYEYFRPNSMHQAYLDTLPQTLTELARQNGYADATALAEQGFGTREALLCQAVSRLNLGYMYFTAMSYYIEPTDAQLQAFYEENPADYPEEETCVTVRHILLTGEDSAALNKEASDLLRYWDKKTKGGEGAFADLAYHNSEDLGSALDGGRYYRVRKGQLIPELEQWCFEEARQPGDTVTLETDAGLHLLYFSGKQTVGFVRAEADYYRTQQQKLIGQARKANPIKVDYSAIVLGDGQTEITVSDLLYPDIAHERFPEIPLYLQQDYEKTMYGNFPLNSNGCGITSLAMLASYMADDELTPPEMCRMFGHYSHYNGTDGMIFIHEPPGMGFYLRKKSHDVKEVKAALQEGQIVISVQRSGYWTRAGHYIVLEAIDENDKVQVRDSNLYNYGKLKGHKIDSHAWGTVTAAASGYWIYEDKVTRIPNCGRCGSGMETSGHILTDDYLCEKCIPATLRRSTYLEYCA